MAKVSDKGTIAIETKISRIGLQRSQWDRLKRDLKKCKQAKPSWNGAGWTLVGLGVPLLVGVSPPPDFLPTFLENAWNGIGAASAASGGILLWVARRQRDGAVADIDMVLSEMRMIESQLDGNLGLTEENESELDATPPG